MTFIGLVRLAKGGHGGLPGKTMAPNPYGGVRDRAEVIQGGVWRYDGFSLSLLDVVLIRTARGIVISDETIRVWGLCFGRLLANALKRKRPQAGDQWYLDEGFVRSQGKRHDRRRALDQDGNVPDILMPSRRSAKAAKRFFRKRLKDMQSIPRVIVTDALRRYAAAKREVMPGVEHRQSRSLNNRAEAAHQPTRQRERPMQRFKSTGHAHFQFRRHRLSANAYRAARAGVTEAICSSTAAGSQPAWSVNLITPSTMARKPSRRFELSIMAPFGFIISWF